MENSKIESEIDKIIDEGKKLSSKAELGMKLMFLLYRDREMINWNELMTAMFLQMKNICNNCGKIDDECNDCPYEKITLTHEILKD